MRPALIYFFLAAFAASLQSALFFLSTVDGAVHLMKDNLVTTILRPRGVRSPAARLAASAARRAARVGRPASCGP